MVTLFKKKDKIVPCECGERPIPKEIEFNGGRYKPGDGWIIECPKCYNCKTDKTKELLIKQWNTRVDWRVHESFSVFTEKEYKKLVRKCGGIIKKTEYWAKHKAG